MNLQETIQALEAKNIVLALQIGEHRNCPIDSNCPIAVELRRLMLEAGVSLVELLEGYQAIATPEIIDYNLPDISANVTLSIAGKDFNLDLNSIVGDQIKLAMDRKRRQLAEMEQRIRTLGGSLHISYLEAIRAARQTNVLPQLEFPTKNLIRTGCFVSKKEQYYSFAFKYEYKPEYIVSNGIRYKIADEDIETIRRDTCIEFLITKEHRFYTVSLLQLSGEKLEHYHGNDRSDCWGQVPVPSRWDGRLESIYKLSRLIAGSLTTINLNSLMKSEPEDMPHINSIRTRSTELGREGELEAPITPVTTRGWGRRT